MTFDNHSDCKVLVLVPNEIAIAHSAETIQYLAWAYSLAKEKLDLSSLVFDLDCLIELNFHQVARLPEDFRCEAIITPSGDWYDATTFASNSQNNQQENKVANDWFWRSAEIIGRYQQYAAYCIN